MLGSCFNLCWSTLVGKFTYLIGRCGASFLFCFSLLLNLMLTTVISRALSYISSLVAKQLQTLKPLLDLFIIRTLIAYQSLPDPMAYKSDHPQIINICTNPFR